MPVRSRFLVTAVLWLLAASTVGLPSAAQTDDNERLVTRTDSAQIALTTTTTLKSLDRNLVPELTVAGAEIVGPGQAISLRYLARALGPQAPAGSGLKGNGKVQVTFNCMSGAGTEVLAKQTLKFDDFGNAATQITATPTTPCTRVRAVRKFKGALSVAAGGTVAERLSVTPLRPLAARRMDECVPGRSTLCLGDGNRFRAEVDFRDFGGGNDQAFPMPHSREDGLFFFFSQDNWEVLVRVLDGCAVNNNFWVFAGGATNAGFELTVTDTMSGAVKQYNNPLGTAAPAITDTSAFATCP